jgi:hypothetical protein
MTRALNAKNNVNTRQDASNLKKIWRNAGIDDNDALMISLNALLETPKKQWTNNLAQFKKDIVQQAQETALAIQKELHEAFTTGGGNEDAFKNILKDAPKNVGDIYAGVEQEVARLIQTEGQGEDAARSFIDQILKITTGKDAYADFNKRLETVKNNLDELSKKHSKINRD